MITENDLFELISKSNKPVFVDFMADWCGPCKAMAPLINQMKDELGDKVEVVKINIDEAPEAIKRFNIRSVPTFILFYNSEIKQQWLGAQRSASVFTDKIKEMV